MTTTEQGPGPGGGRAGDREPILPPWATDRETLRATVQVLTRRWVWRGGRALVALPRVLVMLVAYSPRGLARVTGAVARYLYDQDTADLRHHHARNIQTAEYQRAHAARRTNLHARWVVAGTVALAVAGPVLAFLAPAALCIAVGALTGAWVVKLIPGRGLGELAVGAGVAAGIAWFGPGVLALIPRPPLWPLLTVGAGVVLALGWHGRNRERHLVPDTRVSPGVVLPLRADVVVGALCSLGSAQMKDPDAIRVLTDPARSGQGYQLDVELPGSVKASWVVGRREELAAALKRELGCVWPAVGRRNAAHLVLYVADQPLAEQTQRPWPLAKSGPIDLFVPQPMFTDQRGQWVDLLFLFASMVVGAVPRMGKALALDTPVPTPDGWTTMGDLRDGDTVYDETGAPCKVVQAHPIRHDRRCYEVVFSDGSTIVADAEHLWQVETRSSRVHKRPEKVLTTEEMVDSVTVEKDGRLNYSVRVAGPLACPAAELPVSPYLLGAWLGDGVSSRGSVCVAEVEILNEIRAEGHVAHLIPSTEHASIQEWRVEGLRPALREAGCFGDKHIPAGYFRASEAQRRALLAGLLDTDGWCEKWGSVRFAVKSQRLAEDFRSLVGTLGYVSTLRTRPSRYEGREIGTVYEVTFCPDQPVFRMPRKAARQSVKNKASNHRRFITEIRPVESVPVRCITVDSPNSLYLVGDQCITTHNTFVLRQALLVCALDPRTRIYALDGKGTGDLAPLSHVAHFYSVGDDEDEIARVVQALRALRAELRRRAKVIRELPRDQCPESKVTSALASRRDLHLEPIVVGIDETQVYFAYGDKGNRDHKAIREELDATVSDLVKRGPALGIIVLLATQQVNSQTVPSAVAANIVIRVALKLEGHEPNDRILGTGAYSRGIDAQMFSIDDKGIAYLKAEGRDAAIVRSVAGLDTVAADKIGQRARALREAAGRLTGDAADQDVEIAPEPTLLDDVHQVLAAAGVDRMHLGDLRARLALLRSATWSTLTVDALGVQLREAGVPTPGVKIEGRNTSGVRAADVAAARDDGEAAAG